MVEIFVDPGFEVFDLAEIDYKTVFVGFGTGEGQGDRPVVSVNECAMAVVPVLAMGKRNVLVGFCAGEHDLKS